MKIRFFFFDPVKKEDASQDMEKEDSSIPGMPSSTPGSWGAMATQERAADVAEKLQGQQCTLLWNLN